MSKGWTAGRGPGGREVRGSLGLRHRRARQVAHPGNGLPALLGLLLLAPFSAGAAAASVIEPEGGPVVLGRTETATVAFTLEETDDKLPPLRLAASVGSFAEPVRVKRGLWKAVYTPPATRYPQTCIVGLWRENGPLQVEFLRFPLHGAIKLPVKATEGHRVTVEVAGQRFGPVVAGPGGQAVVPLVVPPGAGEATVDIRGEIAATFRTVRLDGADGNRLLAVALRPPNAQPRTPARLLVVYDGGGRDFSPQRLQVQPSSGKVAYEKSSGAMHAFRWTPPEKTPEEVTFAVTVENDGGARSMARLRIAAPAPPRPPAPAAPEKAKGEGAARPGAEEARAPARPDPAVAAVAAAPPPAPPPGRKSFLLGTRAGYLEGRDGLRGPRAGLEVWSSLPHAAGLTFDAGIRVGLF